MSTETLDFTCFAAHAAHGPFLVALGAAGLAVLVGTVVAIRAALAEWSAAAQKKNALARSRYIHATRVKAHANRVKASHSPRLRRRRRDGSLSMI